MISFLPCKAEHIRLIDAQSAQASEKAFNANIDEEVVANSLALSAWHDGVCVGAGGIRVIWPGRAAAWALLGRNAGPAMLAITRKLAFVLATQPLSRIEMAARADFPPGCRLALVLGFRNETPGGMKGFFPDGGTAYLFARVKNT